MVKEEILDMEKRDVRDGSNPDKCGSASDRRLG